MKNDPFDNSFDGDGYVLYAQAHQDAPAMPWRVILTINSGCHATTLEMTPDELDATIALLGRAKLALEAGQTGLDIIAQPIALADVQVGDLIVTDGGFGCCPVGPHRVQRDATGLYFDCDEGHHYIDGQIDNPNDVLVGIGKLAAPAA